MPKGHVDAKTAEPAYSVASFAASGALRGTRKSCGSSTEG